MKSGTVTLICLGGLLGVRPLTGCNAKITGQGEAGSKAAGTAGTSSVMEPPIAEADAVALLTDPPSEPVAADIACTGQAVVPRGRIWRLSATGYQNSIKDSLGYSAV